jgi:hypothetical protein
MVPVLLQHMSAHIGLRLYYGNRTAQPKRVRAFLDLALSRLHDCIDYVLADKELARDLSHGRSGQAAQNSALRPLTHIRHSNRATGLSLKTGIRAALLERQWVESTHSLAARPDISGMGVDSEDYTPYG